MAPFVDPRFSRNCRRKKSFYFVLPPRDPFLLGILSSDEFYAFCFDFLCPLRDWKERRESLMKRMIPFSDAKKEFLSRDPRSPTHLSPNSWNTATLEIALDNTLCLCRSLFWLQAHSHRMSINVAHRSLTTRRCSIDRIRCLLTSLGLDSNSHRQTDVISLLLECSPYNKCR